MTARDTKISRTNLNSERFSNKMDNNIDTAAVAKAGGYKAYHELKDTVELKMFRSDDGARTWVARNRFCHDMKGFGSTPQDAFADLMQYWWTGRNIRRDTDV